MSVPQFQLTGDPEVDDITMWRASAANAWSMLAEERNRILAEEQSLLLQDEDVEKTPPLTDRGRLYDNAFDVFRKMGQRFFNPDTLGLKTYRLMMEDSQIASSIQVILAMTTGSGFDIVGGEEEHRKFIKHMFAQLPMIRIFEQALSALWVGYSVTEKVFGFTEFEGQKRFTVKKLKVLPPQSITFDVKDNGEIIRVIQNAGMMSVNRFNRSTSGKEIKFQPNKVIVLTYDGGLTHNFGNHYGESILKPVYKDWFFKEWIQRHQNKWLELMAGGILIANAGRGSIKKLSAKVNLLRSNANITLKEGQTLETIKASPAGSAFLESIHYHDQQITKGLLVPVLLLGENAKFGSKSLSDTHFRLFQQARIQRSQQMEIDYAANIINQVVDQNWGSQEGNPKGYPRLKPNISTIEERSMRMKFLLQGIKGQMFRENDIPDMREFVEWSPAEASELGPPLINAPGGQNPDSSSSAGDGTIRDTDSTSVSSLEMQWQSLIMAETNEMFEEQFEKFFNQLGDTLDSFVGANHG